MKVVVVGSGLIGVSSAYFLRRLGHEVTVIDRASGPGEEASFANAALLTPGMSDPWNAPGAWKTLLRSLGPGDSALRVKFSALLKLELWRWARVFQRNCDPAVFRKSASGNLSLALHSL